MATLGKLPEFHDGEDWREFIERLDAYFFANTITGNEAEEKKRAILLTVCGSKTYSLMKNLLAPRKPTEKTYKELVDLIASHLSPKPLVIVERFKFYRRDQKPHESINDYVAALRKAAENCEFGTTLEDMLRDRLVCGVRTQNIQRKLLEKADLTLNTAISSACSMEIATAQAAELQPSDIPVVKKVTASVKPKKVSKEACWRCGRGGHSPHECRFKDSVCYNCNKKGHLKSQCRGKRQLKVGKQSASKDKAQGNLHAVSATDSDAPTHGEPEQFRYPLLHLNLPDKRTGPYKVPVVIENHEIMMEIDTGAAISIMSSTEYSNYLAHVKLLPCETRLKTYTGEAVETVGEIVVKVAYGNQLKELPLVIVQGQGPSLLGRNWLNALKLNWQSIKALKLGTGQGQVDLLKQEYKHLFKGSLGKLKGVVVDLEVKEGAKPKFFKPRPMAFAIKEKVEGELKRLEDLGVIEKVKYSDWASPIVPVSKPNGSIRICGDFKVTINPWLKVPDYPFPTVEELFATLNGGQKFTKLDLTQAYQQMELDESSRNLVCINTHVGLYRYTRMPYGISSAPAKCQETMDKVLQGLNKVGCIMDDIIITGASTEEHLSNLRAVLDRLSEYNIQLNEKKCSFLADSVEYFAFRVDKEGIHPTDEKVKAMITAPVPVNKEQLKSWLGLINYYRRFIPNLATLVSDLNELLKEKVKWHWGSKQNRAFSKVKELLSSASVLTHFDPNLPIVVASDASPTGLGAVISHIFPDRTERPIAFASRTLSPAERNYSQIEREALGIIFAIQRFHIYLYGRDFILETDNQPLSFIFRPDRAIPAVAASRIQRWAIQLSGYQYEIRCKKSHENAVADGLSRLPMANTEHGEAFGIFNLAEITDFHLAQLNKGPINSQQIARCTQKDPLLAKVHHYICTNWEGEGHIGTELAPYFRCRNELTIEQNCILKGIRVVIPAKLQGEVLSELHAFHEGVVKMKSRARGYCWWPSIDTDLESMLADCESCRTVIPAPATKTQTWVWPTKPWQRLHADFCGPIEGKMFLLVIDAHSKWLEAVPMTTTTSTQTIAALKNIFATHGLPVSLVTDNGPQFTSEEFETYMKFCGIKHVKSPPYHPQSNGEAERVVRTFKNGIKKTFVHTKDLHSCVANFLLGYRTSQHSTTGSSPAELLMGRKLKTRLDHMLISHNETINQRKCDSLKKPRQYTMGQKVFVRDYRREKPKWTCGTVVKELGPVSYRVQTPEGFLWKRHSDQMRNGTTTTSEPAHGDSESDDLRPIHYRDQQPTVSTEPVIVNVEQPDNCGVESATTDKTCADNSVPSLGSRYPSRQRHRPHRLIEEC